ncbi:MAG: hypothetical protein QXS41_02750 [Candidatus Woesearchaeota archaeon]
MKTKRSQVEFGINWIFVIVAGGLILLFFITIALSQRKQSDIEISGVMSDAISQSLVTGLISERYYNEFQRLGSFNFQSICVNDFSGFFFNNAKKELNFIFFAPPSSKFGDAVIWGLKWKISYSLTNVLYLLFTGNKIIIVNSSKLSFLCDNLNVVFHPKANVQCVNSFDVSSLKSDLSKEIIDSLTVVTDRNDITIDNLKEIVSTSKKKVPVNHLKIIKLNAKGTDYGKLSFISSSEEKEFTFSHYSEFIGAIVSSDYDFYECMIKKRSKLNLIVTKIYMDKSLNLSSYGSTSCSSVYNNFIIQFKAISEYDISQSYLTDLSKLEDYVNKHKSLENFNKQLIWYNCEILI